MGTLFAKLFFSKSEPIRVCMLGLDAAGKTTVLQHLKTGSTTRTLPTIGFNVETISPCKGLNLTIWDVGGQDKLRQLWKHYYTTTEGIVFVVDSADKSRFDEAMSELHGILHESGSRSLPIVVLANKQDLPGAIEKEALSAVLEMDKLPSNHPWHIENCCAVNGTGVKEAMTALSRLLKKSKSDGENR